MSPSHIRSLRAVRLVVALCAVTAAAAGGAAPPATRAEPIVLPTPKGFADAVAAIERATGAVGEPLEAAGAALPLAQGRSFAVDGRIASRLLEGSHRAFLAAGVYLFRYERSYGMGGEKDRLAVVATTDRERLLRAFGTGSAKRGVTTDRVVAWLAELEKEDPFELTEVGVDYLAGRFLRPPKDPAAVARRSAELAPELVAGRAGTLDLLSEEIRANRTLYLIW